MVYPLRHCAVKCLSINMETVADGAIMQLPVTWMKCRCFLEMLHVGFFTICFSYPEAY